MPEPSQQFAMALTSYVVLLFSLSVHESAHGWTASQMGDDTARSQGRVSLNPIVHMDFIGTVIMPLLQFVTTGIPLLAWAKPTPVQAQNFRSLSRGHILVAGAGPVSNIILTVLFTIGLVIALRSGAARDGALLFLLVSGIRMNIALAVFNLVPLPPLDGSWIASWGLPRHLAVHYDRVMEPYGSIILLVLFVTGALGFVVNPLVSLGLRLVEQIAL